MAFSLGKLVASNPLTARSLNSFHPVPTAAGSYSRFFSTDCFRLTDIDKSRCNLKPPGNIEPGVLDVVNNAFCPRLSAIRNFARLLNLMDDHIRVESLPNKCPRWDVMEDAKALYLVRDMSQLPKKDVVESCYMYPHELRDVFGCVRIHRYANMVKLIVGLEGPDPGAVYEGYLVRLYVPAWLIQTDDMVMDVEDDILKIAIPKQNKGTLDSKNHNVFEVVFTRLDT